MINVTICEELFEPDAWITYTDIDTNVLDFLMQKFDKWPDNVRFYLAYISDATDVTPHSEDDLTKLATMDQCSFFICLWPADPVTIGIIVAIAIAAVALGLQFLLRPKVPAQQEGSPNNQLSDRQNKARPNERIPDIYGTVRSTLDLLQFPYKIFNTSTNVSGIEEEHSFMCIGRGSYTIIDCVDGTTQVNAIDGEYCGVYAPNTSPNSGDAPLVTFGTPPATVPPIVAVQQSNAVNGQILRPPNFGTLNSDNNVSFVYPNGLATNGANGLDFTDYFVASTTVLPQYVTIYTNDAGINASDPGMHAGSVGITGTYQILTVSSSAMTLTSSTIGTDPNWEQIQNFTGEASAYNHSFQLVGSGSVWVGPYVSQVLTATEVWFNFVAPNGLYYIDSDSNQHKLQVTIQVGIQSVDQNNNPIGDEILGSINLTGSRVQQVQVGNTLKFTLPTPGSFQVRAQRLTNEGTNHQTTYVEQIQWRDLFAVSAVPLANFGNVTTVQTITIPTQDALSIKERKLNMLVTRNLPTWSNRSGSGFSLVGIPAFSSSLFPSNNAADIICAMSLDPFIGRRQPIELDVAGIYSIADSDLVTSVAGHHAGAIESYFGTALATEFCYTFDDSKVSFEESLAQVCAAINCIAYRQGSVLSINFEQKTSSSVMLFNHRNKLPKTETRTITFGTLNDNDGIEYTFIDVNSPNAPNIDTSTVLYFPTNQTAQNPKKITGNGVRNRTQAMFNGWRLCQKLFWQNTQTDFNCTTEAALLVIQDRILVADNTRADTQDGEILNQAGMIITTSQPLILDPTKNYICFIQHYDKTVQAIPILNNTVQPQNNTGSAVLTIAPTLPLIFDNSMYAKTTYQIVANTDQEINAFLVSDKPPQNNLTYKLTATNYSDNYYLHDTDVKTGTLVPATVGYGTQGYTGSGYKGPTLAAVTMTSTGYSESSYSGSTASTHNNVPSGDVIVNSQGGTFSGS